MKAHLLKAANEVILDQKMLVNVISRRVRQLSLGHRPLVEFAPGMGLADVALTEVIKGSSPMSPRSVRTAKRLDPAWSLSPLTPAAKKPPKTCARKRPEFGVDRRARLGSLRDG